MQIGADPLWLTALLLLALRLGPLFVLAPVFGAADVPVRLRVLLGFAFALMLLAAGPPLAALPDGLDAPGALLEAAAGELMIGAALAFGLACVFGAFQFGGRLLDLQIGFGVATLFDPTTRTQAPLIGTALNLLALTVFFTIDGHHMIVRAVAESVERIPPGAAAPSQLDVQVLVAQFGTMFTHGLAAVAPAVFALLLLDVALAVVARTMPQMNIFIVAMPLKVVVGLAMLALSLGTLAPLLQRVFAGLPVYWRGVAVP